MALKVRLEQAKPIPATHRTTRTNTRNIDSLAASMALEGLRHPVLLLANDVILDGGRRMAAARKLGWTTIPAKYVHTVEDAVEALYESDTLYDDDTVLPRTMEEVVILGLTIEALDHRDPGGHQDYLRYIGGAISSSGSKYVRARYVVQAARSTKRPAHVVTAAKQAMAAVDAGTISYTAAYNRVRAAEKADVADVVDDEGMPPVDPPSALARSPRARALRIEWCRALAGKGATSEQIAGRLGIGIEAVKRLCRDSGITLTADAAIAKTQRKAVDPDRAMRVAVDDLDALVWSLERVDVNRLNPDDAANWAKQLGRYARGISRVAQNIKGVLPS